MLCQIKKILDALSLCVRDNEGQPMLAPFNHYFDDENELFAVDKKISVAETKENKELLDKFEENVFRFREIVDSAISPPCCGCLRSACWGYRSVPLFHFDD